MDLGRAAAALPVRTLGRSGITVPGIGIGCWAIGGPDINLGLPMGWSSGGDEGRAMAGLETAWELGARLYDTADVYGHGCSERILGRLIAQVPRDEIVVSSKVGYFAGTAEHGFDPRHMRRQLEQTLDNLGTGYLDIYALHHSDFGDGDRWLRPAVQAMRSFREQGLIRAVGMRGPHRFALDRLSTPPELRGDKIARFQAVFQTVQPDVLAVRDNLLTPDERSAGVFAFAQAHDCGVLVNKPLAQGLLTGVYNPHDPRVFGEGDHRSRKRWFTPEAIRIISDGLQQLRSVASHRHGGLTGIALWSCLNRYDKAAVLVGFTSASQVRANLTCLDPVPPPSLIAQARVIMAAVQAQLDGDGEVFLDEPARAPR
jgi:methylglyoxal reductase